MPTFFEQLDAQIEQTLRGWNIYTTILAVSLIIFLLYPVFTARDPDTHPLLLSRQSSAAPIRQQGESAVYRSLETPNGYPLRSGLNVKDEGMSKWATGRDGDLRDIWRQVIKPVNEEGQPRSARAKIMTIYGKEEIEQHDLEQLTKQINAIGSYIKSQNAATVAVSLPNCVETLVILFASAFYGFNTIMIPPAQSERVALGLLAMSGADFLIAQAGSIPSTSLRQQCPNVKATMWVVEKTSRHMEWKEDNTSSVYHEIIDNSPTASTEIPVSPADSVAPGITTIWQDDKATSGEVVSFTQGNIVAAVAAQLGALPKKQCLSDADLFFPADALSSPYILVQTLAALYASCSVALNSVAGRDADLAIAASSISPTIIACSAQSALKLHQSVHEKVKASSTKKFALNSQTAALKAGFMPPAGLLTTINPPAKATLGKLAGKLRLLFVFERVNSGTPPLSSQELSDLRAFTGARVIYCLTAARVAGTIAQTAYFDYRIDENASGKHSHFGTPVSSVEIKLVDTATHKTPEKGAPRGSIVVSGPAVFDQKADLEVAGTFRRDGTLAYA